MPIEDGFVTRSYRGSRLSLSCATPGAILTVSNPDSGGVGGPARFVTGRYPAVTRTSMVVRSSIRSRDVCSSLAVRIVAFGRGIVAKS